MPRINGTRLRQPARAQLGVAPARKAAEPAELPADRRICPGCKGAVKFRGSGKMAGTLYAHGYCRFGTPTTAMPWEYMIIE